MKFFISQWFSNVNKTIIFATGILFCIGIFSMISLSRTMDIRFQAESSFFAMKHIITSTISILSMFIFSAFSKKLNKKILFYSFIIFFFLTVFCTFLGPKINGARRWLHIGISIQPAEALKNLILFPASILLSKSKHILTSILLMICCIIVLLQPDLGMTLLTGVGVCAQVFALGEYIWNYIKLGAIMGVIALISTFTISKYAHERIATFLGTEKSYQVRQSLSSFSNSKFIGTGNLNYIPDSHCDFIFSYICCKFGFSMSMILIIIPSFIMYKLYKGIESLDTEDRLIVAGFAFQFAFHAYFHILSNLHVIPTKGTGFPLVSAGGTSEVIYGIMMGVILSIKKEQKITKI